MYSIKPYKNEYKNIYTKDFINPNTVVFYINNGDTLYLNDGNYVYRNQLIRSNNGFKTFSPISGTFNIKKGLIIIKNDFKEKSKTGNNLLDDIYKLKKKDIISSIDKFGLLCDEYLLKDIFNKKYNLLLLNFTNNLINHYGNRRLVLRHTKELLDISELLRKELNVKTIVCFDGLDKEVCKHVSSIEGMYPKLIINYVDEYYPYTTSRLIKKKYLKEYKNKILYLDTLTTYKLYNIFKRGVSLDHKYISITGNGINNEKYLIKVKYGTTLSELLKKMIGNDYKKFEYSINNPFIKTKVNNISCLTIDDDIDVIYILKPTTIPKLECIRCGKCISICPMKLNPIKNNKEKCIKCGLCNQVCPSNIDLVGGNHE